MPAQVTPAVLAPKAAMPSAKAAMCAANATTAVSSERGRRHQQCAANRGNNSELAYH
jgi:hypothetical protein